MSPALLAADEVRAVVDAALAFLDDPLPGATPDEQWDPVIRPQVKRRVRFAVGALRFALWSAAELADPALMPWVERASARLRPWRVEGRGAAVWARVARRHLLTLAPLDDGRVAAVTADPDAEAREIVAGRLDPAMPEHRRALEALTTDPHPQVRAAARERLGPREAPWWHGKLSRDPVPEMPPEDAERLLPILGELSAILDIEPYDVRARVADVARCVAELPDVHAFDLLDHALPTLLPMVDLTTVLAGVSRRPALPGRVLRWLGEPWRGRLMHDLSAALGGLPEGEGAALALLREALAAPLGPGIESPAAYAVETVSLAWQEGWGDEALVALLAAHPEGDPQSIAESRRQIAVDRLLARVRLRPERLDAHVDTFAAGPPGPGRSVTRALLDRAPHVGPERLDRLLGCADDGAVVWAAERALREAGAADRPALWERLFALPAVRAKAFGMAGLGEALLPATRAALRAAGVTLREAGAVLEHIGLLWGGLCEEHDRVFDDAEELVATGDLRRRARARVEAWLPPELRGAPTEPEWESFRALWAAATPEEQEAAAAVYPEGPLGAEDLRRARSMVAAWLEGRSVAEPYHHVGALGAAGDAADLDLVRAAAAKMPARWGRVFVTRMEARLAPGGTP